MTVTNRNKYENVTNRMYEHFCDAVFVYIESVYDEVIKPYVDKYKLVFLSGNGTWYMGSTDETPKWFVRKYKGYYHGAIDPCKTIQDVLNSEVYGMPHNCLGSLMPSSRQEVIE